MCLLLLIIIFPWCNKEKSKPASFSIEMMGIFVYDGKTITKYEKNLFRFYILCMLDFTYLHYNKKEYKTERRGDVA